MQFQGICICAMCYLTPSILVCILSLEVPCTSAQKPKGAPKPQ